MRGGGREGVIGMRGGGREGEEVIKMRGGEEGEEVIKMRGGRREGGHWNEIRRVIIHG